MKMKDAVSGGGLVEQVRCHGLLITSSERPIKNEEVMMEMVCFT